MDPMEEIWNDVALPGKDGNKYISFKGLNDLSFLYLSGFVDVNRFGFKEWTDSFQPSQQKDGSYLVTHDQWLEKRKFRYDGPIGAPFDPLSLEEREYTEAEFLKILSEKVIPNTIFEKNASPQIMANLRLRKKLQNGKVILDKEVKEGLVHVLTNYASPLYFMEMTVNNLKKAKGTKGAMSQIETQRSKFAAGMTAQQIASARFAEIAKEAKKEPPPVSSAPAVSLKDLKKKKREIKA